MAHKTILTVVHVAVLIALTAYFTAEIRFFRKADSINFQEPASEKLHSAAAHMDSVCLATQRLSDSVASIVFHGDDPLNRSGEKLRKVISDHPIDCIVICLESKSPTATDKEISTLLITKQSGQISLEGFSGILTEKWYRKAISRNATFWTGPFFSALLGGRYVGCCTPINSDGGHRGVLLTAYGTTHIFEMLQQAGLNRYGLPYIIDSAALFVAHPLDETRTIGDMGRESGDDVWGQVHEDLVVHKQLKPEYRHINTVTQKRCNEIFVPIGRTGWLMGLSVYDGWSLESAAYASAVRRCLIRIYVAAAALLIGLVLLWIRLRPRTDRRIIFTICPPICLAVIILTIVSYNRYPSNGQAGTRHASDIEFDRISISSEERDFLSEKGIDYKWDPQRIVDTQSLNNFLERYKRQSEEQYDEPVKFIPTAFYIDAVQFVSNYEVRVAGYAWQKFVIRHGAEPADEKYHDQFYTHKGIIFPGAQINSYEQTDSIRTIFEGRSGLLVRWRFDVNLPQQLSYALFPFGHNEITLPVWSTDLDDNTVLVPDLDSYKQPYPDVCPGLGNNFRINGWSVLNSYYSYSMDSYLCNFGNSGIYGINRFPELQFSITVSRKFLDSLVCKIIPIAVVLTLLFTILFVRNDSDGFNNIIGCSGLFFVLVFDHISLRESMMTEKIMYLEFCYFFSYMLLLLITVTSFRLGPESTVKSYFLWTDKILKYFFWTIMLGAMLLATIFKFY